MINSNIKDDVTFEEGIKRLEEIVRALEDGKSSLDEALHLYEEGIRLYRMCNLQIEKAEQKITALVSDDQGLLREIEFEELRSE
ncbi:MAG: exodeoxyribonuclease VII small subunit [Bacillota bacterium]